jgi:hypothetical protein
VKPWLITALISLMLAVIAFLVLAYLTAGTPDDPTAVWR